MTAPKLFLSHLQQEKLRREMEFYTQFCDLLKRVGIKAGPIEPTKPKPLDWSRLPGAPRN